MSRAAIAMSVLLFTCPVFGQSNRTFVATTGVDSGTVCAATAPCRNISYALTQTNSGGDIVVQDSGGYGSALTINKSINIIVPDGIYATLTPQIAGTNGITIAAGGSDIIRIDGLSVLGTGAANAQIGVSVGTCKRTELSNMKIRRIGTGVSIVQDVKAYLRDLVIADTNTGIRSAGLNTAPATSTLKVYVTGTTVSGASRGVSVESGAFIMGEESRIAFATTDAYIIDFDVASCSSITNGNYFNNFTGQIHPANGMCCSQDLRRGDINQGNCNAN